MTTSFEADAVCRASSRNASGISGDVWWKWSSFVRCARPPHGYEHAFTDKAALSSAAHQPRAASNVHVALAARGPPSDRTYVRRALGADGVEYLGDDRCRGGRERRRAAPRGRRCAYKQSWTSWTARYLRRALARKRRAACRTVASAALTAANSRRSALSQPGTTWIHPRRRRRLSSQEKTISARRKGRARALGPVQARGRDYV